ncbi:MBL fold metallo-hydrolase [Modestobacter sp. VKM Ac-2986]|uniref:MBL fold metallo-hydrolase n=1 Tax=Modestobacter sp. VKM Ac-2986 TaxID=3004140 RepID=UPI0022AA9363|nr:MBL fold metallo-hydrolase [Modestobacter sp. VKM Ac-2986]MCZ2827347.1 MBL fold metallo-hydrolase [Modestobacter sp. VKM Ac-2986]
MQTPPHPLEVPVQLTKHGHACVVLSADDRRLVVDPGAFTADDAWAGASALLVTHEHADHLVPAKVRAALDADPALEVWTNTSVAEQLDHARVHAVGHGDTVTAAGFEVSVHGEWHAVIHPDLPRVRNVGFLVEGQVFHPGDALTVPEVAVPTLLLPAHAPWSRTGELIDYLREVRAERALAVHDGLLNDTGLGLLAGLFGERGPGQPTPYERLSPGESVDV